VLLKAFAALHRRRTSVRLMLLGDGSLAPDIHGLMNELGIGGVVHAPGRVPQEDLPEWFRMADAYVSSAMSDGTSVSLLEAMATGLPVVVSESFGNLEWVKQGVNGALARILPVSTGNNERYCVDGECSVAVTPGGTFRIGRKAEGLEVAPLGELWWPMYFNGGIAIHGSPSVPAYPASHGCIRIPMYAAPTFFNEVSGGTRVHVLNSPEAAAPPDEGKAVPNAVAPPDTTTTTAPAPAPATTTTVVPETLPPTTTTTSVIRTRPPTTTVTP